MKERNAAGQERQVREKVPVDGRIEYHREAEECVREAWSAKIGVKDLQLSLS